MRTLTVITATHRPSSSRMYECLASVLAARRRLSDWRIEWLVVDSSEGVEPVPEAVRSHAAVIVAPHNWGPAAARNLALDAASGRYVVNLDHDDFWFAGMLDVIGAAVAPRWVAGMAADVDVDGTPLLSPGPLLQAGACWPDDVRAVWQMHGVFPVMCSAVVAETRLIRELGGWAARFRSEDVALYARLLARHPGLVLHTTALAWRRSESQTMPTPDLAGVLGEAGCTPVPMVQPVCEPIGWTPAPPVLVGGALNGR